MSWVFSRLTGLLRANPLQLMCLCLDLTGRLLSTLKGVYIAVNTNKPQTWEVCGQYSSRCKRMGNYLLISGVLTYCIPCFFSPSLFLSILCFLLLPSRWWHILAYMSCSGFSSTSCYFLGFSSSVSSQNTIFFFFFVSLINYQTCMCMYFCFLPILS